MNIECEGHSHDFTWQQDERYREQKKHLKQLQEIWIIKIGTETIFLEKTLW